MSKCSRCGLPDEGPDVTGVGRCYARIGSSSGDLACRDRELANLHSLLRRVTTRLEQAHQAVQDGDTERAARLIEAVLEALS